MSALDAIRITVIGQVGVEIPDSGLRRLQPAQRQLLSLLVAAGPDGLTADRLADEIWPDRLPNQWQASVRMTVSRLRRSSGLDFVKLVEGRYCLKVAVHQVDAWYVGQLTARSEIALTAGDADRLNKLLASSDIFPGVDQSLTIEVSAREIEGAQVELIKAAARQGLVLGRPLLRSLYRRFLARPFDETLGVAVARLHALAGLVPTATEVINLLRIEVRQMVGTEIDEAARTLERQIRAGQYGSPAGEVDEVPPAAHSVPAALKPEPRALRTRQEASDAQARQLIHDGVGIVLGPAGSSPQEFLASVVHHAGPETGQILYAAISGEAFLAYEPFLKWLPGLRRAAGERGLAGENLPPAVAWALAADELTRISQRKPVTLVINEAHHLDSASIDLVLFLVRSSLDFNLRFLIAGRSDYGSTELERLTSQIEALVGIRPLELGALGLEEITGLVALTFPHAAWAALHSVGEEILAQSQGLPAVVYALIETLDPVTLRMPPGGTGHSLDVFRRRVSDLSEEAQSLGIAAAVLGPTCSVSDLGQMSGLDPDRLLDVIDELLDTGLINETAGLDRISFAHQLAMDEFLSLPSRIRLRQMHIHARNLTDDPHRRARHDLNAVPNVDVAEARISQLRSARLFHGSGSFREAAVTYRNALKLVSGTPLENADAIRFADAVSRTGGGREAALLRSEVVTRCVADGDWKGVLAAAIVGLPEAELVDGDPERFAQLSSIPFDRLPRAEQLELSLHMTRQASLLGREQVARVWGERARTVAATPSDRAKVTVAWRMANDVRVSPNERLGRVETALLETEEASARLPLLQLQALDFYQLGRTDEALAVNEAFGRSASELGQPLRQWHARLFRCMHLYTIGEWDRGRIEADIALADGQRYGITVATSTRLAQEFFLMWLAGSQAALVEILEATPPEDASSLLFQAAHSSALFKAGQEDRAIRKALTVAQKVIGAPVAHGLASVALVAPVLAASERKSVLNDLRQMFLPLQGTALIVGAGLANLGPIDRYIAQLNGSLSIEDAQAIVKAADGLGMPLWRLIARLDLAKVSGLPLDLTEVVPIVAGTSFNSLVDL